MSRDSREEELNNLKLALATFALQLHAFEVRLKSRSLKTTTKASQPRASDIQFANKIISAMKGTDPNSRPKSG